MADMRQYAGGGPEMQQSAASLREYHAQGGHIGAQGAFQSSTGPDRITPTPEEARRAQEAARRAQGSAVQSDMAREAKIGAYAAKQAQDGPDAVIQNCAYASDGTLRAAMFKDRPLVDDLCARLAGYCGEGGMNEGVVETLDRLLAEVRAARQGPQPPPLQDGPHSAMLGQASGTASCNPVGALTGTIGVAAGGIVHPRESDAALRGLGVTQQLRAPGKMFSRMEILAVLRSRKAVLEGRPHFEEACRELDTLIDIYTRME